MDIVHKSHLCTSSNRYQPWPSVACSSCRRPNLDGDVYLSFNQIEEKNKELERLEKTKEVFDDLKRNLK